MEHVDYRDGLDGSNGPDSPENAPRGRSRAKKLALWAILIAGALFFSLVLREAADPYGDQPYIEITHGDHSHYVPPDRDPKVSISKFPRVPPGPNEIITPEGRIVPKE